MGGIPAPQAIAHLVMSLNIPLKTKCTVMSGLISNSSPLKYSFTQLRLIARI